MHNSLPSGRRTSHNSGFSLLEIIAVISIIAVAMTVVLPNFGMRSKGEIFSKLGRLRSDIRAAYDEAVLSGQVHRLVFHLASGRYWLETTKRKNFYLGGQSMAGELTAEDVESKNAEFEETFERYAELAKEAITDPSSGEKITIESPVLKAKESLRPAKWSRIKRGEWKKRSLSPELIISRFMAAHHSEPVVLEDLGDEAVAHLYFFPAGYVENAMMHIYYQGDPGEIDESEPPFTLRTHSHEGGTSLSDGLEEIDINEER